MTQTIDDIRARFGLGAGDRVRFVGRDPTPRSDVARGLASAEQPLDELMAEVRAGLQLLLIEIPGVTNCKRIELDSRLIAVELAAGTEVVGVTRALGDDVIVLDTRFEVGYVHWYAGDGERVARFRAGECEAFAIERASPPAVAVPPLAQPLGEHGVAPWLRHAFDARRDSPSLLQRIAAAGLLRRLWAPPPDQAAAVARNLLAGASAPPLEIDRWARALPRDAIDEIERAAVNATADLEDEIGGLAALHADAPASLGAAVRAVMERRDDLESVRAVLRASGGGEHLTTALAEVDEVAALHATVLAAGVDDLDAAGDELLVTVGWSEPDAWWGWHDD
jgi:hypothetical protein